MLTGAVVEPQELVAVSVYAIAEDAVVGVPEIIPVVGFRLKPATKELSIE